MNTVMHCATPDLIQLFQSAMDKYRSNDLSSCLGVMSQLLATPENADLDLYIAAHAVPPFRLTAFHWLRVAFALAASEIQHHPQGDWDWIDPASTYGCGITIPTALDAALTCLLF